MLQKHNELLAQLVDKTARRLVSWEPTAKADEFLAAFKGEVSFTIAKTTDPNFYGDIYAFTMRDPSGREMLFLHSGLNPDLSDLLRALYFAAHDAALKVDETLDAILDELRQTG